MLPHRGDSILLEQERLPHGYVRVQPCVFASLLKLRGDLSKPHHSRRLTHRSDWLWPAKGLVNLRQVSSVFNLFTDDVGYRGM